MRKYKCKQCKEYKEESIKLPKGRFCSEDCIMAFLRMDKNKRIERARRSEEKKKREAKSASSKAVRDLNRTNTPWQHKQTQKVFNRMRVLQELMAFKDAGKEPECISCGKKNMDWCCGHYKTVGSQGALRYDALNTFLQCNRYCNMGLSGNIHGNKTTRGYTQGLYERFGIAKARKIIDHCETTTEPVKWSWEELEAFRAGCAKEVRRLEALL